jgi:hypothetical protein
MKRLVASGLLPERAGNPVRAWAHISLADLLLLDGDSALQEEWTAQVRARWAASRAFAAETGSEGGAWLDGQDAEAIACDAAMAPIVTGDISIDAWKIWSGSASNWTPGGTAGGMPPGRRWSRQSPAKPSLS